MNKTVRALGVLGMASAGLVLAAGPASAHITPDPDEAPAGSFAAVTLTVPHGCEDSPTKQLKVQIPDGVLSVTPQVKPGWDISAPEVKLDEPVKDDEGEEITETVKEVTYTAKAGNELQPHFRDTFTIGYKAPDKEGETLYFKTVQTCVKGETAWIEEWDGEGDEPEHPAPAVKLTENVGEHGGAGEAAEDEGDEAAGGDESAAADDASTDDDSDSNGLAIAGLGVGIVALVVAGFAVVTGRKRPAA
jgi:uncharacterized protein YcnI